MGQLVPALPAEMPVLEQGQRDYPAVRFLYANQGEGADAVRRYLSGEGLRLERVLLDPTGTWAAPWAAACPPPCCWTPTGVW